MLWPGERWGSTFCAAPMRSPRAGELRDQIRSRAAAAGGIGKGPGGVAGSWARLWGGCLKEGVPLSPAEPTGHQLMKRSKLFCPFLQ